MFCKFNEKKELENGEIISIARHLKAGKGLSMFAAVVDGDFLKRDSQKLIYQYDQILKGRL